MMMPRLAAGPRPAALTPSEGDALARRLVNRDVNAFEAFYEAYHRLVFGIGLRLLGDGASAEDLTQAVFLKVWVNPAAFKGGSLSSWMTRVARNAGLDVLRARFKDGTVEIAGSMPLDGGLEDAVLAKLDAHTVREALARLPATERIAIEMGFFGGLTYRGVATEIGIPLGTVKTRIRTGLHRLRRALEDCRSEAC